MLCRFIAVCSAIALMLGGVIAIGWYAEVEFARPTREFSKMSALLRMVSCAMQDYFDQNGRYPSSLSELSFDDYRHFWGEEGSSPKDLDDWSYTSDGSTFSMRWTNRRAKLFYGGDRGKKFWTEEEMRAALGEGPEKSAKD